jgi:feruloyl esterase
VLGGIHAVDPTAPDIKFEVNLPTRWNNRMLQMGGGGFDGTLVTVLAVRRTRFQLHRRRSRSDT